MEMGAVRLDFALQIHDFCIFSNYDAIYYIFFNFPKLITVLS